MKLNHGLSVLLVIYLSQKGAAMLLPLQMGRLHSTGVRYKLEGQKRLVFSAEATRQSCKV